jgi:hypothetical protein
MKEVNIGKQGFLFGTLNESKYKMNIKSFMSFCNKHKLTGRKGLKISDIVRLFKLESSQKGSHIHFREFEILLFKMAKILHADSPASTDEKYFRLVQTILKPNESQLRHQYQYQIRRKKKSRKKEYQDDSFTITNRNLPEIVHSCFLWLIN